MNRTIQPRGPSTAKIMVFTDFPEPGDMSKCEIFTGPQGFLFSKMMQDAGSSDRILRISYLVEDVLRPKPVELSPSRVNKTLRDHTRTVEDVAKEISTISPNVILGCGEWCLQYFTGERGVKKFQGSIMPLRTDFSLYNIKYIPIQHPRDIYRVYSAYYYTPVYIRRALKFQNVTEPFKETLDIQICHSYAQLQKYLRDNTEEPFIVTDIETYYNLISCIGISLTDKSALVIPLLESSPSIPELAEMLKLLQKAFLHFPVVNQNMKFDQIRMERFGFKFREILGDTMLNAGVLYPELPKNLGFLTSLYTDLPYFKDEGKGYTPGKELYRYNGKDCISTRRIFKEQVEEAKEEGLDGFINQKMMKFYHIYRDIDTTGIQVDGEVKRKLINKYEVMLTGTTGLIKEILGTDLNPLSPKQCTELLYKDLKLPEVKRRRADGKFTPTADEDAIEYILLNHVENEEIKELLHNIIYTRKIKRILDYLKIPLHPGDIFHTSYNLSGTETGRTSTSKSGDIWYDEELKGTELGAALQTIPKHGFELANGTRIGADIREMFVPRDGYVFAEGDQSKAEAVIVTILSKDWELYEKFYNVNLHKLTAMNVFGLKSMDDVTTDQYNKGKRVRHAANYDMGPKTLAQQALVSVKEATKLLSDFHKAHWRIRGIYQREVEQYVKSHMVLNTPYGRRRQFFVNPKDKNFIREAYAYIPQSTISDKTKMGMVKVRENCKLDYHFLGESHDSVLAEVRKGQEYEYLKMLKKYMEEPIDMRNCCLPRDVDAIIKFECGLSEVNWKEVEEVEI